MRLSDPMSRNGCSGEQKIERYIWGLSPQIQGSVIVSRPVTVDSAKELAQSLIDHGACQNLMVAAPEQPKGNNNNNNNNNKKKKAWNKRKGKSSQEPSKKKKLVAVHAATIPAAVPANPTLAKPYVGNLPKCNRCNFHHNGNCQEMQCHNCNRKGHIARLCKSPPQLINQAPAAAGVGQACYGCGDVRHFKRDCTKAGNAGRVERILAMGHEEAVADPAVVTGTFLLNNTYACILFDSGAEKSFVSHNFKHLLNQNS